MARKQSSTEVSAIAGKYVRMRNWDMAKLAGEFNYGIMPSPEAEQFFRDIRKLAASVLSQDETKGKRK